MKLFTAGARRLNSAYGFDFLYAERLTPQLVREAAEQWPDAPGVGWPSWAFENHDAPRALSRWTPEGVDPAAFARMKMALLCALRGNIILYNGEELGLDQVEIPFEMVKDRSEEHTSELQSLMRISYAVFCSKKKKKTI